MYTFTSIKFLGGESQITLGYKCRMQEAGMEVSAE